MSNDYFQEPLSKGSEDTTKIILIKLLIEQLQQTPIEISSKADLIYALEIGLFTFYPPLTLQFNDQLENFIDYLMITNQLTINKEDFWLLPTTINERLQFKRINSFEFKKFITFLIKFTNKRAKGQLIRNATSKKEENSLLLEFYSLLSYTYSIYLNEIGSTAPIQLNLKGINIVSANLFEKAYDLEKEFIVCSNVNELVKNYFVCIKFLVDSYFPE